MKRLFTILLCVVSLSCIAQKETDSDSLIRVELTNTQWQRFIFYLQNVETKNTASSIVLQNAYDLINDNKKVIPNDKKKK